MAWISLFLAGICEIIWAAGLKYTDGFTRFYPSLLTITAMILSVLLLAYAMKYLPLGTAYAVWTGIGAVGTVIYGILMLNESASVLRLTCIGLIIIAILGLKWSTS